METEVDPADQIRDEMADTRSALGEKLEKLEDKVTSTVSGATGTVSETIQAVKETVQETKSAVTDTVGAIKETVQETVSTIKDTVQQGLESVSELFNLPLQAQRHPCLVMSGAVVTGFLGARFLFGPSSAPVRPASLLEPPRNGTAKSSGGAEHRNGTATAPHSEKSPDEQGWFARLQEELGAEIGLVKSFALGKLAEGVKALLAQSLPTDWRSQVTAIVDRIAAKLGGDESAEQSSGQEHETQPGSAKA